MVTTTTPHPFRKFIPSSLAEFRKRPPKKWLIENIIGKQDLGMIYGAPGSGKTFVVIDLLMSACTGRKFADRFEVARPLTVAYCAGEGVGGLVDRLEAASQYYGVDDLNNLFIFDIVPQLQDKPSQRQFEQQLLEQTAENIDTFVKDWLSNNMPNLDLLIIDTFHSAIVGSDENSARDMGAVLEAAKKASQSLGCAIILVHHTNKQGESERGSSALRGAMDVIIWIKRNGVRVMKCSKLKDGQEWKGRPFDLVMKGPSVRVWWDERDEDTEAEGGKEESNKQKIVNLLKANPGVRYEAKEIATHIGMGDSKQIYDLMKEVTADKELSVAVAPKDPKKDKSPHNPLVYGWDR